MPTANYGELNGPITFGKGMGVNSTKGSPPKVILAGRYEEIGVPANYKSGAALSDSATFYGTFASLGITPGSYTWKWGTGKTADSLTITTNAVTTKALAATPIAATAVPEPALLGATCIPLILLSRRRRCG